MVFELDESVSVEDLDLLHFPTYLNFLYQSRGIVTILPSNDSPHAFRQRLSRFVTRRRFDSRVRVMDYVGEDEGSSYVVNFRRPDGGAEPPRPVDRRRAIAKAIAAEKAAQGGRGRPFIEATAFEIFDTLLGSEKAAQSFFLGVKRARQLGNLVLGILGPGLGSAPAIRRMADVHFLLHHDEVGLVLRGVRPRIAAHMIVPDAEAGAPRVRLVPTPV